MSYSSNSGFSNPPESKAIIQVPAQAVTKRLFFLKYEEYFGDGNVAKSCSAAMSVTNRPEETMLNRNISVPFTLAKGGGC